ncbi:ABC transporter ATP-binding protein [Leptolyngbya boryana NIES-2135]|jgi:manganese/iron transport system ATP-binding protein|uniref:ABC transporter ATP-binding protein n=1 Tax=Leptolyngbya boryana NIES-2135 TaxID=1973484 RepID=A0A1Z4JL93_LEPBY|nr:MULTISPECIES: metal ABC transporter ATP-binding protein [Leptolyngbya]BAY57480.1 ABC transporter ATP-binding protein [Leptolyngbya boryana NIES-2135]MBD2368584.1 metal ABC transporter ATP-binding protein [Leptolyngbya sp. FACHB-161]MBD2375155.1 metal ABC transporter ATP-binding protein [Leptolyngbya sp. FACHB-238]MBD2399574.1 metal ABC transporter ATP-binding protein [Leptolyngbya sp. FACHB-239]MBD2405779.1 metal ABC transporter ATP-binding protein [Leptolyngbya sp. FACHB-402]
MQSTPFFENSYPRLTVHTQALDISPNLTVENLSVKYRAIEALTDVSVSLQSGRLVGIFGPNGAGKSTLIKAMLGLIPAVSGAVQYEGKALVDQLDRVAYVPQRSQIDWSYPVTVWDVVMMGRTKKTGWFQRYSSISRRLATQALERVGMMEFRDRAISDLSGGQQQRVFLARALAQQADVFCFDEPFVGIDQKTQTIMFDVFKELTRENKLVLVVNHDLGESIVNFDELILLNKSLVASGSRQKVLTQENLQQAYGGKVVFFSDAA